MATRRTRRAPARRTEDDYEDDEVEMEEAPPRRRATTRTDDDEAPPRRRRRTTSRTDDDEDEEERPARRRRTPSADEYREKARDYDDEDDEYEDDEPPRRGRGRGRSDDDDERPSRAKRTGNRGWDAGKKANDATSSFTKAWEVPEDEAVIFFLEDGPFDSWLQHWIDGRKGKKSFTCLATPEDPDKECPLCDIGNGRRSMSAFNIAVLELGKPPKLEVLEAGPLLFGILQKADAGKNGPLYENYWAISKSGGGKKGKVNYAVGGVKERDLGDDWDLDPIDDRDIDKMLAKASEVFADPANKRELLDVANEVLEED